MATHRKAGKGSGADGSIGPERGPQFWERIRELEGKAASERGRMRAVHLTAAGDLFVGADLTPAAAKRYGGAIDAYLEAGYFSFAHRMCLRLIEAAPQVIRAHATLALIFMGRGLREEAEGALDEYVTLSRNAGETRFAVRRLCLMAQVVEDEGLRSVLLEHIRGLAADADSEPKPCLDCGRRCEHEQRRWETPGNYWERLVDIGLMGPHELLAATANWNKFLRTTAGPLATTVSLAGS